MKLQNPPALSLLMTLLMLTVAAAQTNGSDKGFADQSSTGQGGSSTAEGAISEYLAKETAIDDEVESAMETALEACKDSLLIVAEKLEGGDKIDESAAVRKEIKRIDTLKMNFLPNEALPSQARAAWRNLIAEEAKITKAVAAKRAALRSEYYRKLNEFEKRQGADVDVQHLRGVRATMMIRSAVESGKIATSDLDNPDSIIGSSVEFVWMLGAAATPGARSSPPSSGRAA